MLNLGSYLKSYLKTCPESRICFFTIEIRDASRPVYRAGSKNMSTATETFGNAIEAGQDADSVREAVTLAPTMSRPSNLAAGAMTLLITLMIILLAALVGGQFAEAIPSDSTFSNAISTTTDNAGTAFVIFGVALLAIPTVSVLAYLVTRLGGFIGFGGMGRGGLGR